MGWRRIEFAFPCCSKEPSHEDSFCSTDSVCCRPDAGQRSSANAFEFLDRMFRAGGGYGTRVAEPRPRAAAQRSFLRCRTLVLRFGSLRRPSPPPLVRPLGSSQKRLLQRGNPVLRCRPELCCRGLLQCRPVVRRRSLVLRGGPVLRPSPPLVRPLARPMAPRLWLELLRRVPKLRGRTVLLRRLIGK